VIPRQWFVTEHVREKFSCRSCETIAQPPAPFHVVAHPTRHAELLVNLPSWQPTKLRSRAHPPYGLKPMPP
jgi:hypothetical protein